VRRSDRPGGPLFARAFADARVRTIGFAYVFAVYAWLQAAAFHKTYPTLADRIGFAHAFAGNDAIRLFYGYPYDVLTVGGYCAWRVGGTLSLAAAVFGVLAAVRAFRAEEDAGRAEMVLAGAVRRRTAIHAAGAAIQAGTTVVWVAEWVGFVVGGLPPGGSAYLALATASVVPVFAGVGTLASQLAPNRRMAMALGFGVVAVSWLLRVVSDTVPAAAWVRWITPLGWAEALRPFARPEPLVLLLTVAVTVPMVLVGAALAGRRDVGTGLLASRDTARPRTGLLWSATTQALRGQRATLGVWAAGVVIFAFIFGKISTSVSTAGIPAQFRKEIAKLGLGSITTPAGYLAFVFVIFILAVSLFACSQVGVAREEEAGQRLETLLSLPISRTRWLGGRLGVATVAIAVLSGLAGLLTWAGAASQGVRVPLLRLLEAGANCLPVALLFLGLAALAYAVAPRAQAVISYGLATVAFLWYLVGSLLGLPRWVTQVTPFQHVGLVPVQPFQPIAAGVMIGIGAVTAALALAVFARRDLLGS
jgi:ABC-2 type transport system permease protein